MVRRAPGTGGTQRLSRLVGKSKAIELMITGNTFSFEEAREFGIVTTSSSGEGFMENILEYARQFTPPNKAAKAVGRIKRAVQTGWEIPMESAWRSSARINRSCSKAMMQRRFGRLR